MRLSAMIAVGSAFFVAQAPITMPSSSATTQASDVIDGAHYQAEQLKMPCAAQALQFRVPRRASSRSRACTTSKRRSRWWKRHRRWFRRKAAASRTVSTAASAPVSCGRVSLQASPAILAGHLALHRTRRHGCVRPWPRRERPVGSSPCTLAGRPGARTDLCRLDTAQEPLP